MLYFLTANYSSVRSLGDQSFGNHPFIPDYIFFRRSSQDIAKYLYISFFIIYTCLEEWFPERTRLYNYKV